jgi:phosphoheptose isomerase
MISASNFLMDYIIKLFEVAMDVNQPKIDEAYSLFLRNMDNVVIFGNGGSAAIADHFCADFVKGVRFDTDLKPKCTSLTSNGPLLTALANDMDYGNIFQNQISYHRPSLAIAVSSSGNSTNVTRGLEFANFIGAKTIALVGFDGGKVLKDHLADVVIHVNSNNYGIVEDSHMMILHSLVQKIRTDHSIRGNNLKL